MYMASASENIKFSKIADNYVEAQKNINFPKPVFSILQDTVDTTGAVWNKDDTIETADQVYFDGSHDYLRFEDKKIQTGYKDEAFSDYISGKCWTFNCWYRKEENATASKFFLGINTSSGGNYYLFGYNSSERTYSFINTGSQYRYGVTLSQNVWHMLTVSQRGFLEQYNPAYEYHSSNSIYNNEAPGTGHGRAQLDSPQAWSALADSNFPIADAWWQIELNGLKMVYGAITQGRANSSQWVKTWKFQYSTNGSNWKWVDDGATFTGNTNQSTKKKLVSIISENNQIIQTLGKYYKYSFKKRDLKKYKKNFNYRVIGMGGSSLGTKAIYDFLKYTENNDTNLKFMLHLF